MRDGVSSTLVDIGTTELLKIVCGYLNLLKKVLKEVATVGTTIYQQWDHCCFVRLQNKRDAQSEGNDLRKWNRAQ